jgi:serine/threonine-protein kinase
MVTTDLGACEWFVWDLRRSNLLDRGQLDQVVGEFLSKNPGAEPPALAEYLISQGILTQFQAGRLLQGKTQGFVLGPFTLMDTLGTGSMGTVYKAHSKNNNQWYAVKVLPRRSMWNVRIARRKVRAFEQCKHPAVVPFVDVGTAGGMHYLAWPLVEGEPLDRRVLREGKLPAGTAAFLAYQTADGLKVCHEQGLFHGLLKPSNLMVARDGQIRILDSGIGALLAETDGESLVDTMSTANSVASGLDCASPESIMDPCNLTPLGDQYSLGCVLYYCLTGRYPFPDGSAAEKMVAHQFKQPVPLRELAPEVPEELAAVVDRLMQKAPEARYPKTADVLEALQPFVTMPTGVRAEPARTASGEVAAKPRSHKTLALPADPTRTPPPRGEELPAPKRMTGAQPMPRGSAAALSLPSRQSLRGTGAAPSRPASPPPAATEPSDENLEVLARTPPPRPAKPAARPAPRPEPQPRDYRSWDERLGPVGIAIVALIACALAWMLTWKLF